jgi:MraZ protein
MATINQNSAAPVYMGEFRHALDGKNRLTIPAAWRSAEEAELFLIPSSTSPCLTVRPRADLDRIRTEAAAMSGAQRAIVLRRIGSLGHQVTVDKNGRLSLPEEFCSQLKLTGEVTLSGAIDTFEIWNTAAWDASRAGTKAVADAFMADLGL